MVHLNRTMVDLVRKKSGHKERRGRYFATGQWIVDETEGRPVQDTGEEIQHMREELALVQKWQRQLEVQLQSLEKKELSSHKTSGVADAGDGCGEPVGDTFLGPFAEGTFQKVCGTGDDSGLMYEVKMTLLVFLRCLANGGTFRLASNLSGVGKFDDVVAWHGGSGAGPVCVQLKHKARPIRRSEVLALGGKYSVLRYFVSYRDEVLPNVGEECRLAFYTNAEIPRELFTPGGEVDLLTSSQEGSSFFFTEEDVQVYDLAKNAGLYLRLLQTLDESAGALPETELAKFVVEQISNSGGLDSMLPFSQKLTSLKKHPKRGNIKKLLSEVQQLGDLSLYHSFLAKFKVYCGQANEQGLDQVIELELRKLTGVREVGEVFTRLLDRVRTWWKSKTTQYLTESHPLWRETVEDLFRRLSESKLREIRGYGVSVRGEVVRDLREALSTARVLHMFVDGSYTVLASCKVRQALEGATAGTIFAGVRTVLGERASILGAWTSQWGEVLVLEVDRPGCDLQELFSTLSRLLKVDRERKLVVITNINDLETANQVRRLRDCRYVEYRDTTCLADLERETQDALMRTGVLFQGHKVPLEKLVARHNELKQSVDEDVLMRLLRDEEVKIGQDLAEPTECYIPRTLRRGGETVSADDPWNVEDRAVVITGEPGMGKSTLLAHLATRAKSKDPSMWVVLVQLSRYTRHLDRIGRGTVDKKTVVEFLETIAGVDEGCGLERCLFKHCWQITGRLMLFVDGFDEICPAYEGVITQVMKTVLLTGIEKVYVTSRVVCREVVEETVNSSSFVLDKFTEVDQREFLKKMWWQFVCKMDPAVVEEYVTKILDLVVFSLNDVEKSFAGIPLQTMFIAEMFKDDIREYQKKRHELPLRLDVLKLYEGFFRKKCEINYREKRGYDLSKKGVQADFECFKREVEEIHKMCALVMLLTAGEVDSLHDPSVASKVKEFVRDVREGNDTVGVIHAVVDGKPVFVHRTFAEYFLARWLSDHYRDNAGVLERLVATPGFYIVFGIFNSILADGCELHAAVLSQDLEAFRRLLRTERVDGEDGGGRTALHLAAGFCPDPEFTGLLLERGADLTLRDGVLGWTALRYADATRKWGAMSLLLKAGGRPSDLAATRSRVRDEGYVAPALSVCCEHMYEDLLFVLVTEGVDTNLWLDSNRNTALHVVANSASVGADPDRTRRILHLLINSGADVNARDGDGRTILHVLARRGELWMVRFLNERAMVESREEKLIGTERLFAVLQGRTDKVMLQRVMTQYRDDRRRTALDIAVQCGNADVARYLAEPPHAIDDFLRSCQGRVGNPLVLAATRFLVEERGAEVGEKNKGGKTVLHFAAELGDLHIVQYLLGRSGVATDVRDWLGDGLIHYAARKGRLQVVKYLVEEGVCDPNAMGSKSPLMSACSGGHLGVVQYLVRRGALCEQRDYNGDAAVHVAAYRGDLDMVQFFVEGCGQEVDALGRDARTALHEACSGGHRDVAQYLVERGSDVEARDSKGDTPFHKMAANGALHGVRYLLSHFRDVNVLGADLRTPLHVACARGHLEAACVLVRAGASTGTVDVHGDSALHMAARAGALHVLAFLLEDCGMDVDLAGRRNQTPLHIACGGGHVHLLGYLLGRGASPSVLDRNGDTPLHLATSDGDLDAVRELLECGVDPDTPDGDGRTALHVACTRGDLEAARLLVGKGARCGLRDRHADTPLHDAAEYGRLQLVRYLLDECRGIPNVVGRDEMTPLHKACAAGHLEVAACLIQEHRADTKLKSRSGKTALDLAKQCNSDQLLKYLAAKPRKRDYLLFRELKG